MQNCTVIKLSGSMAQRFGRTHYRVLDTSKEVFRALSATIDGFEAWLRQARALGLDFVIFRNRRNIGEDEFGMCSAGNELRIIPVIRGSKRAGVFQIVAAAAIAAFVWWNPIGWTAATQGALYAAAGSMAVGGVVQMLSPQVAGLRSREDPDNKPSYAFGGPVNTTAAGNPVPLLYGQREIGGAIISAGIYTEDQQ